MQQLVDTVRATGAPNLILLGGVQYSRINAQWLNYEPSDPMHNLAASWHLYPNSYCNTQSCWDAQFQPFLSQAAAVATEIGQGPSDANPCGVDFLDSVMLWLDAHSDGYLAWTWDAWGDCFSLIGNWGTSSPSYAPTTPYGRTYHDHLLGIPQPPTSVVDAAGNGTVAVSWQPPVDQGTTSIGTYQVTPHDLTAGVDGAAVSATGTSANVPAANGHTYTFTVTASNNAGTSAPSAASAAVTPQAGLPAPAAATGTASATTSTTVTTGSDPAATGGTTTQVTVPAGTSGGIITVTQGGTSEPAPAGYTFGGVQIDISAPAATQTNPLTLVFTTAMPTGYPAPPDPTALTATDVYRAEGAGSPQPIPACNGAIVDPEPACARSKQYVSQNGSTYIQVTVITETASHWNSALPTSTAVNVSNSGYSPVTATARPGGRVTWTFTGNKQHSVTDSAGLGAAGKPLFDSGVKTGGSFAYQLPAAGTYAYKSTAKGDSFTGAIAVAPVISHPGSSYVVIWAAGRTSGYLFNVKYRFKPTGSSKWGSWTTWQNGTPNPNATFVPPKTGGTYDFQASLRNAGTGKLSGYSPDALLTIP
jgi:plastocyanin